MKFTEAEEFCKSWQIFDKLFRIKNVVHTIWKICVSWYKLVSRGTACTLWLVIFWTFTTACFSLLRFNLPQTHITYGLLFIAAKLWKCLRGAWFLMLGGAFRGANGYCFEGHWVENAAKRVFVIFNNNNIKFWRLRQLKSNMHWSKLSSASEFIYWLMH